VFWLLLSVLACFAIYSFQELLWELAGKVLFFHLILASVGRFAFGCLDRMAKSFIVHKRVIILRARELLRTWLQAYRLTLF